jgi:glycosyltransferase involved in cell wall biosynthesis
MNKFEQIAVSPPDRTLYIVIPYYNESDVIGEVIEDIWSNVPDARLVIVDDGSARKFPENLMTPAIACLSHCCNLGQGAAIQTGITYSLDQGADIIITFDADGQHQASDILPMVSALIESGNDIVFGSRFLGSAEKIPGIRKFLLKSILFFYWVISGVKLTDYHNGFRAMNRKAAETIIISQNRMAHATEIFQQTRKHKLIWKEVPVHIRYTKYSIKKGQRLIDSLKIITDLLLKK